MFALTPSTSQGASTLRIPYSQRLTIPIHVPVCTVLPPRYKCCTPPWRFISPDAHTLGEMQRPSLAWPHASFILTYYQWRSSCAHTARLHNLIHHHFLLYGQLRYLVLSAAHAVLACPTTHASSNIDSCAHTYYSNTSLRIQTRFGSVAPSDVIVRQCNYIRRMRKLDDEESTWHAYHMMTNLNHREELNSSLTQTPTTNR